jgi:DNA-binding CsgD family transcriptional regulator
MPHIALTQRQYEVLQLLLTGLSNREIALKLGLSVNRLKKLVGEIYLKTRTLNRLDLFRYAWANGLIATPQAHAETPQALTRQQRLILEALWQYSSQEELARHFGITTATVNYHLQMLYRKTGTHTHTQLLRYAIQRRWITPETMTVQHEYADTGSLSVR